MSGQSFRYVRGVYAEDAKFDSIRFRFGVRALPDFGSWPDCVGHNSPGTKYNEQTVDDWPNRVGQSSSCTDKQHCVVCSQKQQF